MKSQIPVSIGIMAYNEEQNIVPLVLSLVKNRSRIYEIEEIIVVSSGSTDSTDQLVGEMTKKYPLLKLITQKKRYGKASAINLFLSKTKSSAIVLMSADIKIKKQTLEVMLGHLKNSKVGMVGAHPIPLNSPDNFMGYTAHLLWGLHHQISLKQPKMGEMIAFRKIFKQIPVLSAVDEANIEPLIRGQGYKVVYAPKAIIYNKSPENLAEFISVRRRIYAGHLATRHEYSYEVSTLNGFNIFSLMIKNFKFTWRYFLWTPLVVMLEAYCRALGWADYKFGLRSHTIWQVAGTTKLLEPQTGAKIKQRI